MKEIKRKDHTIQNPKYKIFDYLMLEEFDNQESERNLSDRLTCFNMIYNIVTCITWGMGATNTCCIEWIWDGTSWAKMMQQPYFCCDSITYWTDQSQGFNIGLDTSNIVHNPDSMTVYWGVCTGFAGTGVCYAGQGMYDYFPQVTTLDTIKVGYDVYIYENGVAEVCSMEEWLVFDGTMIKKVLLDPDKGAIARVNRNTDFRKKANAGLWSVWVAVLGPSNICA